MTASQKSWYSSSSASDLSNSNEAFGDDVFIVRRGDQLVQLLCDVGKACIERGNRRGGNRVIFLEDAEDEFNVCFVCLGIEQQIFELRNLLA